MRDLDHFNDEVSRVLISRHLESQLLIEVEWKISSDWTLVYLKPIVKKQESVKLLEKQG
jgi:hypothetical protein